MAQYSIQFEVKKMHICTALTETECGGHTCCFRLTCLSLVPGRQYYFI